MRLRLSQGELDRFLPAEPQLASHCRRVATLAGEIATRLELPSPSFVILEQAALLHHLPPILLHPAALDRLIRDVLPARLALRPFSRPFLGPLPEDLDATLGAFLGTWAAL